MKRPRQPQSRKPAPAAGVASSANTRDGGDGAIFVRALQGGDWTQLQGRGEFCIPIGVQELKVQLGGGGQGAQGRDGGRPGEMLQTLTIRVQPGQRIPYEVGRGGKDGEDGHDTMFHGVVAHGGGRY
ncbi:glycine-rich domain-containing protein [Phenylobacterium sp.]|uniref:glycine-rich domain-containing protein n=1 Tax=Phenylobacterium sp. TaxID=1871053 RepID=UPI0035B16C23